MSNCFDHLFQYVTSNHFTEKELKFVLQSVSAYMVDCVHRLTA